MSILNQHTADTCHYLGFGHRERPSIFAMKEILVVMQNLGFRLFSVNLKLDYGSIQLKEQPCRQTSASKVTDAHACNF